MNIFRILAQGDGTINEPNVSAFLGYLLNPGEDHGLDSLFLEKFLKQHYLFCESFGSSSNKSTANKKEEKHLSDTLSEAYPMSSKYEVKVFFEQAFKKIDDNSSPIEPAQSESKKEVVDIIFLVYEIADDGKIETKFENYLKEERELKHIFLIEVKVKNNSTQSPRDDKELAQLESQILKSRNKILHVLREKDEGYKESDIDQLLSAIFVSPGKDSGRAQNAFIRSFNHSDSKIKSIPKSHIFWNKPENANIINDVYEYTADKLSSSHLKEVNSDNVADDDNTVKWESIEEILDEMISPDKMTKQIPMPQYTIDTIKSFSDFIYSDFSYKFKKPTDHGPGNLLYGRDAVIKKFETEVSNEPLRLLFREIIQSIEDLNSTKFKYIRASQALPRCAFALKEGDERSVYMQIHWENRDEIEIWLKHKYSDLGWPEKRGTIYIFESIKTLADYNKIKNDVFNNLSKQLLN